jgi:ankyrin repeat protein
MQLFTNDTSCVSRPVWERVKGVRILWMLVVLAFPITADAQLPLHEAAVRNDTVTVRTLLAQGADVSAVDQNGFSPLHVAAMAGNSAVAELLLDADAEIETTTQSGWHALNFAAQRGHPDVVELLLERGADVESRDEYGWTSLHQAADEGHPEVAAVLLAHGADKNAKATNDWRPLHYSARAQGKVGGRHAEVARLLIEAGARIKAERRAASDKRGARDR